MIAPNIYIYISGGELKGIILVYRELNCKKTYYIPKDAEFCPLSEYIMPHSEKNKKR